jgi:2,4-dienoyl-CoA reductase-like NADH-dependent reductase (Old Yellow Enzyme family)
MMKTISTTHHRPITDPKLLISEFTESTTTSHQTANLFTPLTIGDIRLPNRVIMSPLTRARAGATRTPNGLMAEYYRQRASAGLIIGEATSVDPMGVGYADTPGIWSEAQVQGWRGVTDAVHAAGGRMVLQLWHVGRISDPMFLDGQLPVAPSAIAPAGNVSSCVRRRHS